MGPGNYPDSPQLAVGAVVMHRGRVLLVKRGQPPAKGLWSIPGGKVQLGETLQAAAEREILEETGLIVRAGEPILVLDMIRRDTRDRVRFHYVIIDLAADYVKGRIKCGSDASDARWVLPDALCELKVNQATLDLLKDKYQFG